MMYSVILDKVLVKKLEPQNMMYVEGNDILRGEVLAVGKGTKDVPMSIVAGNLVLFNKSSAIELPFGNDLFVLRQEAVIAIEDETEK